MQTSYTEQSIADELMEYLESHDSGIPFVSSWTSDGKTYLLWQYKRDDFLIDFNSANTANPAEIFLEGEKFTIYGFSDLEKSFNFIRNIESERQRAKYPLLQVGPIPWKYSI